MSDLYYDDGPEPCPQCGEQAALRTCAGCGVHGRIIECEHMDQPRPIAPNGRFGQELSCVDCELDART